MHDLVIYGAGGLGREILFLLEAIPEKRRRFLGFIDDGLPSGSPVFGNQVVGDKNWLLSHETPLEVVMGIASPQAKAALYTTLEKNPHLSFPVLMHPTAQVAPSSVIEEGSVLAAFCVVGPEARLGKCTFLNWGSHVGHDSTTGDFCTVMPSVNISGNVAIGRCAQVGVGAKIVQGLTVGEGASVGMGSIVVSAVPDRCTVFGNPAKIIKRD